MVVWCTKEIEKKSRKMERKEFPSFQFNNQPMCFQPILPLVRFNVRVAFFALSPI